jgi:MFS family permease
MTDDQAGTYHALQRRTVRTLAAAQILTGIGIGIGVTAGSLLVVEVTGSDRLAGLAQTCGVVGAALAAAPLARLSTRHGRRWGLTFGLTVAVVGAIVVLEGSLLSSVVVVLLGMLCIGSATAVGLQVRYASTDLAEPRHAARDLSIVVWATTIGAVLGPTLLQNAAGLAGPLGLPDMAGPYLVTGIALALAAIVIFAALRPDPLLTVRASRPNEQHAVTLTFAQALRTIRGSVTATYGLVALTVGQCAMVMVMVMTPVHMQHVDVALRVIGLVISVHILGMYAFSPLVGALTDRIGGQRTIVIGAVILLGATLLAGTAAGDATLRLGWGLFFLGLGWSFTLIAGSALLSSSVPENVRPSIQGTGDTVMNGAAAVTGAAAGIIVAVGTYGWLNVVAAALVLGLLVFAGAAAGRSRLPAQA